MSEPKKYCVECAYYETRDSVELPGGVCTAPYPGWVRGLIDASILRGENYAKYCVLHSKLIIQGYES